MLSNRLTSLRRALNFGQIYGNCLSLKSRNDLILKTNQWLRCVHSSNTHEIDFLFTKYKLKKISNGRQSYGQKSALHHFNTIEDFNLETDRDVIVETLRRLLDIRKMDGKHLIKEYPNLAETRPENLEHQVLYLCDRFTLDSEDFLNCPWTLYLPINFVSERLNLFSSQNVKRDHLVLLLLSMKTFERVLKSFKNNKLKTNISNEFNLKLDLFTKELHLISEEFCDLVHENSFLFYYDFEKLKPIMDLVVKSGISVDTILSDIRIFTHNIDIMKQRINICLEHNMPIKTWMLRSPEEPFRVSLRRHLENHKVLKDYDNNIEYLAKQLRCQRNVIQSLMKRYPRIVRISANKLCQMLSLLFDNGYTPYHIIDTPKVLFHSVETIDQRIQELQEIKIKANSLKILTLSEKEYQKLLTQLKQIDGNNS